MSKIMYLIDEERLRELLIAEMMLDELEHDGVDSWEWYGESHKQLMQEWSKNLNLEYKEDIEYEDIADKDIELNYEMTEVCD